MPSYNPADVERRWQQFWESNKTFRTPDPGEPGTEGKPKFYVLDMFPYPSGAGLHVGHPEGYTATDILARFKRMNGFHVLHPMGWDAYGLPAEQYAVEKNVHPRITTQQNINTFRRQIKSLGFSYDWDREVDTTDPNYFKWTQWIFLTIYDTWYDPVQKKGRPIAELPIPDEVRSRGPEEVRKYQDDHRLAYQAEVPVNWCPALGTVLANEEVIDGKSERGNHPVERRPLRQWLMRITAYAERLLDDLEPLDWSESIKLMQRNWIGKSEGADVEFEVMGGGYVGDVHVFTTRPDTLFGATYMVLSPEHALVEKITTPEQKAAVKEYQAAAARKSDFERTETAKKKTGVFTGAYAVNPVNGEKIPIWIADYVLATYGTGAIMAVPGHDERDFEFAQTFGLPIITVVEPAGGAASRERERPESAFVEEGVAVNSGMLDGLPTPEAKAKIIGWLEEKGLGKRRINYKLRDWLFSRQRYWGEPFPVLHGEGGDTVTLSPSGLPLVPPDLEDFKPTGTPEGPLSKATDWVNVVVGGKSFKRETNTMPQWAGSCWYFLRYIDPKNGAEFADPAKLKYWLPVDLYVGGAEHAVLHLLYSRFWHKVLFDRGYLPCPEPFQRLVNQGMILGEYEYHITPETYEANKAKLEELHIVAAHVPAKEEGDKESYVLRVSSTAEKDAIPLPDEMIEKRKGKSFLKGTDIELTGRADKMSKSRGNVVNPDDIVKEYGADSLRLYEMFMGPLEAVKPWNTKSVEGVYRFLSRAWRVIVDEGETLKLHPSVKDAEPDRDTLRVLHRTIQKVTEDTNGLRFNTAIAAMMEFVNHVTKLEVRPRSVVEPFVLLLAPYAPHIAEELWRALGRTTTLAYEPWPKFDPELTRADEIEIPVQVNGKLKARLKVPAEISDADLEAAALADAAVQSQVAGKTIKMVKVVPRKLVNVAANRSELRRCRGRHSVGECSPPPGVPAMANEQPTEAHVPAEPRTEPHREATTDAVPASDIPMAFAADDTPPGASDTAPEPQAASYRIVRKLGEGGMGAVFLAEQQNPRRPVALKVIRSDRVSPRMLQRFRLESQILAWVRHPAVAQVYEAGEMDGPHGRHPYYAMEYVEGETLTRFAARQELDVRGRLELLAEVCDGVEAAHRRGVTHRDLKPANILVTADGRPKILDFGIARVSDPDVPAVQQTDFGQVIGTLNYMSPEQAAGDPAAIDTRADVYSPGVILYELLSDRLPIDVTGKSLPTAVQAIRTVEPPPLAAIDPKFRGDLTAIAGKALAKPPAERYQSAAALAADIRRHLSDQPIEARPPGAWVALRKWARRNKAVAAAAALAAVALVAGTGAASYGLLEAKAKEKLAQEEATKARNATAEERKAKGQAEWELRHRTFINATLLQRQGRYKESLEQYRDAQRFGYEDATGLLLGFADCYGSLGRSKEYDELIRQIAARKDHGKHQAEVWLRLAGAGFTGNPVGGDPDELVRKALKSGLSPAREEFARGMIAPNIAEMERHFAESVRLDPADVEVNGLLFACQLFLGRVPQARQTVARLEMLRPGSVYALVTAVLVALFERNPEELDAAIGRLHALSPARADAYRKLATALQPVLDDDVLFKLRPDTALPVLMPMVGAIQAIAAATDVTHETEPDLAFTAFARLINFPALRWVKELKLPDMLAMLAAAKSGNPGKSDLAERFADAAPSGMTHLLRGMIRGIQGKPLEARAELRKATEVPSLFPVRKPALVLYALDLLPTLARDRGEFIRVLREIVKMGPVPQEEFANLLARAALKVGQPELAALVAADMIARNPDDPRTLAIRATIFLRHGAYGRAHALAEQLLKLKPDDLDGKDIQEMAAEELAKWKAWDGGGAKKAEVPPIPTAKP